jgi:Xaa-Pro aminopeptidase
MLDRLDAEMKKRSLDAVVVFASVGFEPTMHYLTRGAQLRGAVFLKKPREKPLLVHNAMERDELTHLDFEFKDFGSYDLVKLATEAGSEIGGWTKFFQMLFEERGIRGRVFFSGRLDVGKWLPLLEQIKANSRGIELVSEEGPGVFDTLRTIKEKTELGRMRELAEATTEVMGCVASTLKSGVLKDGELFIDGGEPLTLGQLKEVVRIEFARRGLMEEAPSVVAMSAEAGVPHNRGTDSVVVKEGCPIVVDIFPSEIGGGYCSDMTRTFCIGEAPQELKEIYADVLEAQEVILASLKEGAPARSYQKQVCEFFKSKGHPTVMEDPTTLEGYVHGLGHGVGLDIHELPRLGGGEANKMTLSPGMVFTVEPGLYYPSRGMGVRIEDLVYIDEAGEAKPFTVFPKSLSVEDY